MATRWPGVKSELGIKIAWRFAFVPPGTLTQPSGNTVYLDVGGGYGPGVIDHHQGGQRPSSAASLLADRPDYAHDHLVASLPRRSREGDPLPWSPTIVVHSAPDFDAIVSSFLLIQLIEEGVPPRQRWNWLVEYADRVDQGREQLTWDGPPSLYPLMLMVTHQGQDSTLLKQLAQRWCDGQRDLPTDFNELRLCAGLYLVTKAVEYRETLGEDATNHPCGQLGNCPLVDEVHTLVKQERTKYVQAKQDGTVEQLGQIMTPDCEQLAEVPLRGGLIRTCEHALALDRWHMRSDDPAMPLTVVAKPLLKGSNAPQHRYVISIDPGATKSLGKLTLAGLGASLELAEQRLADRRKGTNSTRSGVTRFPEYPGIEDPWYDGRAHQLTIVDSPTLGTVLTADEIVSILKQKFWQPEIGSFAGSRIRADERGTLTTNGLALNGPITPTTHHRLHEVYELIAAGEAPVTGDVAKFLIVVLNIKSAWGERSASGENFRDRLALHVTGSTKEPLRWQSHATHIGPNGIVVFLDDHETQQSARRIQSELEAATRPSLRLIAALQHTDDVIRKLGTKESPSIPNWTLRTRHVQAVAEYWTERGKPGVPESSLLMDGLEFNLGLQGRIDGVGQLLEHLDDSKRRIQTARLNRLVVMLGAFGVIQASANLVPNWVVGVMVGGSLTLCGLLLSGRFCRMASRCEWLRSLFFDDVEFRDDQPPRSNG